MLLILISWMYIAFTLLIWGTAGNQWLKTQVRIPLVKTILGLGLVTFFAGVWAFFGRIHWEFHLALLVLNVFLGWRYYPLWKRAVFQSYLRFQAWSWPLKGYFVVVSLLLLAQCASAPYVIDNESYYIQNIKWLNEYGLVKGLINLHFFLGQLSGWHIAQSAFNFSFLYDRFNDLSGLLLWYGFAFAMERLSIYFERKKRIDLVVGLFPLTALLLFQFVSAPSPDVVVYVLSFLIFYLFITEFHHPTRATFVQLTFLVLFTLLAKNTALTLALLPLYWFVVHFKTLNICFPKVALLCGLTLGLFVAKNVITCGVPVFPSQLFSGQYFDYSLPPEIEHFYYEELKKYGYFLTTENYDAFSRWELFLRWLQLPKMNGLFNKLEVLLLVLTPFVFFIIKEKGYRVVYGILVIQLGVLFATSPQYRFFLNGILFLTCLWLSLVISQRKAVYSLLFISLLPVFWAVLVPVNLNRFSNYRFMLELSHFKPEYTLTPHPNSKYQMYFESLKEGNLNYYSPKSNDFFWGTYNGPLPTVNKEQIEYFKTYFHLIPQQRTNNLKDGFYSKYLPDDTQRTP